MPVTSILFVRCFGNTSRKVEALVSECKIKNIIAVILKMGMSKSHA